MDSINYKKDFVFMTDKTGNLTGGGFKIQSDLLKQTIHGSGNNNSQYGGRKNNKQDSHSSSIVLDSLKDMVIPAGLFCAQDAGCVRDHSIKYQNHNEPLHDSIYDKLLELVTPGHRMIHSIKTRRKREKPTKKSRKR
jgi:hypothetical protein